MANENPEIIFKIKVGFLLKEIKVVFRQKKNEVVFHILSCCTAEAMSLGTDRFIHFITVHAGEKCFGFLSKFLFISAVLRVPEII